MSLPWRAHQVRFGLFVVNLVFNGAHIGTVLGITSNPKVIVSGLSISKFDAIVAGIDLWLDCIARCNTLFLTLVLLTASQLSGRSLNLPAKCLFVWFRLLQIQSCVQRMKLAEPKEVWL
jgi:hypothetical protein